MDTYLVILTLCSVGYDAAQDALNAPVRQNVQHRDGDILIGGLVSAHQLGNDGACSDLDAIGIQTLETMNMIIDEVNADDSILPGVTIGSIVIDTCNDDTYALQQVVINMLPRFFDLKGGSGQSDDEDDNNKKVFAGIIGASSSSVSIQVAKLLQIFHIPQISYSSTSPVLSNKEKYKYFFRTVPSDIYQVKGLIALLKESGWIYVSVVYEDTGYGIQGYREIKQAIEGTEICLAAEEILSKDTSSHQCQTIIKNLLKKKEAKVVILFTIHHSAEMLIKAASNDAEASGHFLWVASDGWASALSPNGDLDYENELDGSIGLTHALDYISHFKKYITSITLSENKASGRNPWLGQYISQQNNCTLKKDYRKRTCTKTEHIGESSFLQFKSLQSVADATLAFVHALDKYHKHECGEIVGLCSAISQLAGTNKVAESLYDFLKNTSFTGINGNHISFDRFQDGPAKFSIVQYQKNAKSKTGLEKWVDVGFFNGTGISWTVGLNDKAKRTASLCSMPCGKNEETIYSTNVCCWTCKACDEDEYVESNETACRKCPLGQTPDVEGTGCVASQVHHMDFTLLYGIICLVVSCVGLLLSAVVIGIYVKYLDTPVVKASGAELSFVVLFGTVLTLFNSIAIAARPTGSSCAIARIILGVGPTLMYSGLLTKTMRVVIIFRSKLLSPQMKLFLRPYSQLALTGLIVLVQVFVVVIWLTSAPPDPTIIHLTSGRGAFLTCLHLSDVTVLVGLVFPFLLILICTVLATVNRHVPSGFRETMLIGFTMYTTCVIWLAFLPIFITNSDDYLLKLTTISVCLSLSAFTTLICLFLPYCYKLTMKPNENTSQSVMSGSKQSRTRSENTAM